MKKVSYLSLKKEDLKLFFQVKQLFSFMDQQIGNTARSKRGGIPPRK